LSVKARYWQIEIARAATWNAIATDRTRLCVVSAAVFPKQRAAAIAEGLLHRSGWPRAPAAEKIASSKRRSSKSSHRRGRVPLFAALLGIRRAIALAPLALSPDLLKKHMLNRSVILFAHLASASFGLRGRDAHWSDARRSMLLDLLLANMATSNLLVMVTARTEFRSPWPQRSHLRRFALARLSPHQTAAMIAFAKPGAISRPRGLVEQLVQRTDGGAALHRASTASRRDAHPRDGTEEGAISSESFASRENPRQRSKRCSARVSMRPQDGQDVARLVAVLGRDAAGSHAKTWEFSAESAAHWADAARGTDLLRRSGRARKRRIYVSSTRWSTDAAYQSLMKNEREELHRRVAEVLLEHFPDVATQHPSSRPPTSWRRAVTRKRESLRKGRRFGRPRCSANVDAATQTTAAPSSSS